MQRILPQHWWLLWGYGNTQERGWQWSQSENTPSDRTEQDVQSRRHNRCAVTRDRLMTSSGEGKRLVDRWWIAGGSFWPVRETPVSAKGCAAYLYCHSNKSIPHAAGFYNQLPAKSGRDGKNWCAISRAISHVGVFIVGDCRPGEAEASWLKGDEGKVGI